MGSWNPPRHLIKIMSSRHLSRVNMGLDAMRPTYNLEPKYRVTVLIRENRTRGSGAPPEVKRLVWYTDGSKDEGGDRGWCLWAKLWEGGSAFPWVDIQQYSRPRNKLSWPVPMGFNLSVDRRKTLGYALIVKRRWKRYRPLEQHLLWFVSARRRWMIPLPDMWGFIGSLDMPEQEGMKSPMGWQKVALLWDFLDPSRSWGSLGRS